MEQSKAYNPAATAAAELIGVHKSSVPEGATMQKDLWPPSPAAKGSGPSPLQPLNNLGTDSSECVLSARSNQPTYHMAQQETNEKSPPTTTPIVLSAALPTMSSTKGVPAREDRGGSLLL